MARSHCNRVVPYIQLSGTCWFNAVLAALFYSQHMRNYLYNDLLPIWRADTMKSKELIESFVDILTRRYVSLSDLREYAYLYFRGLTPEKILKTLHKQDPAKFPFEGVLHKKIGANGKKSLEVDWGYFHYQYLPRLLEYMGVAGNKIALFDLASDGSLHTSAASDMIVEDNLGNDNGQIEFMYRRPNASSVGTAGKDIVIVFANHTFNNDGELRKSEKRTLIERAFKIGETIKLGGIEYKCDSMLLTNYNFDTCRNAHDIAGVTCGGGRFMYNGWVRRTVDPAKLVAHRANNGDGHAAKGPDIASIADIPCELMQFDWIKNTGDFCLSTRQCTLRMRTSKNSVCFNVEKSPRTYIFVRERPEAPVKPDGFDSAATSSSVGADSYLKSLSAQMAVTRESKKLGKTEKKAKKSKVCPPEKIVNPKTNRCVKRTGAIGKKILAGDKN